LELKQTDEEVYDLSITNMHFLQVMHKVDFKMHLIACYIGGS